VVTAGGFVFDAFPQRSRVAACSTGLIELIWVEHMYDCFAVVASPLRRKKTRRQEEP
jgi:hypothetical protein